MIFKKTDNSGFRPHCIYNLDYFGLLCFIGTTFLRQLHLGLDEGVICRLLIHFEICAVKLVRLLRIVSLSEYRNAIQSCFCRVIDPDLCRIDIGLRDILDPDRDKDLAVRRCSDNGLAYDRDIGTLLNS